MALGQQLVHLADARAFDAAQLLDRAAAGRVFVKAAAIHFADDIEAGVLVERELGLIEQAVGARAAGLAGGIDANAAFADPDQQAADLRGERDGGMDTVVPGSSMMQASPPIGICTRTPLVSTSTKALSITSSAP